MQRVMVLLVGLLFASFCYADQWVGNVNGFIGGKSLQASDWAPLDQQFELGVLVDVGKPQWNGLHMAFDFLGSADRENVAGIDMEARTSEFDVGVRKIFTVSGMPMHPFIGGGVALISGELTGCLYGWCASTTDSAPGLWLDGGLYWTVGRDINIGFDVRHSDATATMAGYNVNVGGNHAGLLVGLRW